MLMKTMVVVDAAADDFVVVGVVDGRNKYIFGRHGPRLAKFCPRLLPCGNYGAWAVGVVLRHVSYE
jgi:hypothetical protein